MITTPMDHPTLSTEHVARFVTAGDAIFTIENRVSGARFTYRVAKNEKPRDAQAPTHFVQLLTGPQNTTDYQYLGCLYGDRFVHGRKSRVGPDAPSSKAFGWLTAAISGGWLAKRPEVAIHHAGRCGRCGRLLTTPESVQTGLGPICSGKEA